MANACNCPGCFLKAKMVEEGLLESEDEVMQFAMPSPAMFVGHTRRYCKERFGAFNETIHLVPNDFMETYVDVVFDLFRANVEPHQMEAQDLALKTIYAYYEKYSPNAANPEQCDFNIDVKDTPGYVETPKTFH